MNITRIGQSVVGCFCVILIGFGIQESTANPESNGALLPADVTLENGSFVRYHFTSDSTYVVSWGDNTFQRSLPEELIGAPSWFPLVEKHTDRVIVLKKGCGSPCWIGIILPLDSTLEPVYFEQPMAYDLANNLVAFVSAGEDTLVTILNYTTGHSAAILGDGCGAAFFGYCIDSIELENRIFKMTYHLDYQFKNHSREGRTTEVKLHIDF